MSSFQWSESLALGYAQMDQTHHEFVALVDALLKASDEDLLARMDDLNAHTVAHFEQESRWMADTNFPPAHCHDNEHNQVLALMQEARGYVAAGKLKVGRVLAEELTHWFTAHVDFMDKMLADWMARGAQGLPMEAGSGCGTTESTCGTAESACGSPPAAGAGCAPGHDVRAAAETMKS